ncbi:MAG: ATP-binding protein [Planctomycetes bacterium]|nr:ATP-binding protein [Planctomycetota bacterium]
MPNLQIRIREREILAGRPERMAILDCVGFIDAGNFAAFEKALERVGKRQPFAIALEMAGVEYINSTGISIIIRMHGEAVARRAHFLLVGVRRSVALSMNLLGVTRIVPFVHDLDAAQGLLGEALREALSPDQVRERVATTAGGGEESIRIHVRSEGKERLSAEASVLLLVPEANRFTSILRRRLGRGNGNFHLVTDVPQAIARHDEVRPDLVVVDDRVDPRGEFVSKMKIDKGKSLTSIVKIYARDRDVKRAEDFRIWENDYLVDPFELMELFRLAETELRRVPKDRRVIQQQVRFQFRSQEALAERAGELARSLIEQSGLDESAGTALYAAYKEAVDNGIRHGNQGASDKYIDVNYILEQKKITITIEDEGRGFDYEYYLSRTDSHEAFELAKRRILQEGRRGGLGILLMRKCTDRLEYRGDGSVVVLEKSIPG